MQKCVTHGSNFNCHFKNNGRYVSFLWEISHIVFDRFLENYTMKHQLTVQKDILDVQTLVYEKNC